MLKTALSASLAVAVAWGVLLQAASVAVAQGPVVTVYPAPVVGYVPELRGLFGQRLVYRPVVSVPAPVVAAVPAPVTTFYAPAPVARAAYYAPAPVTTFYAPAPVARAAYYAPAPAAVTTYYAPAAPVLSYPARVTAYYAPVRVAAPPVVTYYPPLLVP